MDEKFTQKDEKLELDISELSAEFSAYKRKANRDFRSVKKDIKTIPARVGGGWGLLVFHKYCLVTTVFLPQSTSTQ